ncbi:Villin-1, partial [Orchesella cincta]
SSNPHLLSVFAKQIILYEDSVFQGATYNVTRFYKLGMFVRCFDLPSNWHDRVSSINTNGNCVYAWTLPGCSGKHLHVAPGTPSHYSLSELRFDNQIQSVEQCP